MAEIKDGPICMKTEFISSVIFQICLWISAFLCMMYFKVYQEMLGETKS